MKVRYEESTGKVNLITSGEEELAVPGCKYMTVPAHPNYDDTRELLYVRGGKVVAVLVTPDGKEHVHDA